MIIVTYLSIWLIATYKFYTASKTFSTRVKVPKNRRNLLTFKSQVLYLTTIMLFIIIDQFFNLFMEKFKGQEHVIFQLWTVEQFVGILVMYVIAPIALLV